MIVIVEGLDGCGKTTLCKRFAEKYDFEYIKESYTDDCKEKEGRMIKMLERLTDGKNYIYDRTTLIDDFVYGFLNKQPSTLTKYKNIVLSILSQCHIFHLVLDEETRRQRFEQRGDAYITNEMIAHIAAYYGVFYADLPNVHFFELQPDNEQNVKKIMEEINNDKGVTHCIE